MLRAVILAAGAGTRLKGFVPPYHKPLLIVNGKSLVSGAVQAVRDIVDDIVVVVAPQNAEPIVHVVHALGASVRYVIQPEANGPAEALELGLEGLQPSDQAIVIMGDNTINRSDIEEIVARYANDNVICGRYMSYPEATRFTRVLAGGIWHEGPPQPGHDLTSDVFVWLGPIKINVSDWFATPPNKKNLIGPRFSHMSTQLFEVDCSDIGVPEAL